MDDFAARESLSEQAEAGGLTRRQWVGLLLVPPTFAWFMWGPAPSGTTGEMRAVAALTAIMALLWVCESVPLAATALLPLVFLPVFGIATPAEAASAYAGDLIFLFIGGFILANGIEYWGLHRRVALNILAVLGTRPRRVIGALMATTAFVSLWISNTAAVLLMMPVALSVLHTIQTTDHADHVDRRPAADGNFGTALVLGVSAAATTAALLMPLMGALATALGHNPLFLMLPVALATSLGFMLPVATPPNAVALATKHVTTGQMAWAGLLLNLAGLALIIGVLYALGFSSFGVAPGASTLTTTAPTR